MKALSYTLLLTTALTLACISGCSDDEYNCPCNTNYDCVSGWFCNTSDTNLCQERKGLNNKNGVYTDRIVLGMSADKTGLDQRESQNFSDGANAYLHHLNSIGGLHGKTVELTILDDEGRADRTTDNMKTLLNGESREVFAILGNRGPHTASAAVDYATEKKILFFGGATGTSNLRKGQRYVFNFRASLIQEINALTDYLQNTHVPAIPAKNLAILVPGDNQGNRSEFGEECLTTFSDSFQNNELTPFSATIDRTGENLEIVSEEFIRWLANPERVISDDQLIAAITLYSTPEVAANLIQLLTDDLERIKNGYTSNIVHNLTGDEGRQLSKVRLFFGTTSEIGSQRFAEVLEEKGEYCRGIIVTQIIPHFDATETTISNYRTHLEIFNPELFLSFSSLEGYLTTAILIDAINRDGSKFDTESLVGTLELMTGMTISIGATLAFSPTNHQASMTLWGTRLDHNCLYESINLKR